MTTSLLKQYEVDSENEQGCPVEFESVRAETPSEVVMIVGGNSRASRDEL